MVAVPTETNTETNTAAERQANQFCTVLHEDVIELDRSMAKLERSLLRMSKQRMPGGHLAEAQQDLRNAQERRRELIGMLEALGHAFPCRHAPR